MLSRGVLHQGRYLLERPETVFATVGIIHLPRPILYHKVGAEHTLASTRAAHEVVDSLVGVVVARDEVEV